MSEPVIVNSGRMVLGLLVRIFLTANLLVVWCGYRLMSGQWPGAFKLWLCSVLGVGSLAWSVLRRRQIRGGLAPAGTTRIVPMSAAILVVVLILAEAALMTWITWGPDKPW